MDAFEEILKEYYTEVYRFLLKLSNYQSDVAEELTQDTFLQAYLSISDFKGKCQMKTWLIQIAKNCFYMHLRKSKHKAVFLEESNIVPADGPTRSLTDEVYERELLFNARFVIDAMQPQMREVMLYRIYSDLPYNQIAILLSMSESSAKVLFHRGKDVLRKRLKEDFGYEL